LPAPRDEVEVHLSRRTTKKCYNLRVVQLMALCNLWLLDVETGFMYKKISFRSVPKPGRETSPGFSLRGRATPQKRLGFFGPRRRGPQTRAFLAVLPRTPKSQKQENSEENAPNFRRPKRKPAGRPPGSRYRAPARGRGGKHCQALAALAEQGNVEAIRMCMNRLSPIGQHNPALGFVEALNTPVVAPVICLFGGRRDLVFVSPSK